MTTAAPRQV